MFAVRADLWAWILLIPLFAAGMCWGANTVSHIHLHGPLFRGVRANAVFSVYLSALLGVPQQWWKRRHLRHHGISLPPLGVRGIAEIIVVILGVTALGLFAPRALCGICLPSFVLGLGLCGIQGYYEHVRPGSGIDYRGGLYNRLWFNDGFRAAHHEVSDIHWTALPKVVTDYPRDPPSAWPPVLRWMERMSSLANSLQGAFLDLLEACHDVVGTGATLARRQPRTGVRDAIGRCAPRPTAGNHHCRRRAFPSHCPRPRAARPRGPPDHHGFVHKPCRMCGTHSSRGSAGLACALRLPDLRPGRGHSVRLLGGAARLPG